VRSFSAGLARHGGLEQTAIPEQGGKSTNRQINRQIAQGGGVEYNAAQPYPNGSPSSCPSLTPSPLSPCSERLQDTKETTATTRDCSFKIIVVGTSMGGLHALQVLLPALPKSFRVPVAIAQHRHKDSDESLSIFLQQYCALPLTEPEDKDKIAPGQVYLAPPDYHLLVEFGHFALSTEAPVKQARPSIDVLFESAADAYGENVILTGASNDGSQGILKIKQRGGLAIVQEPTTAESPTMPKAAIAALQHQRIDKAPYSSYWILPLHDIAPFIVNLCHLALR
jgi:two-component system, chemotaxis family, protein-glutamate methylesterase/glutaminase